MADRFYQVMERNALYLDLVAKELMVEGHLSPDEIILRLAHNPDNIFSLSITRLKRQRETWQDVLKPLLGLLLIAREPLGVRIIRSILQVEDEQLRDGLQRLGGLLLDTDQQRYTLFHSKFGDYLGQRDQVQQKDYVFAIDEVKRWHVRLALWCEQDGINRIWKDTEEIQEQERRMYARKYVVAHWYFSSKWDSLFSILNNVDYGRAKIRHDVNTRSYLEDLDLGCRAAAWQGWTQEKALNYLPLLWRYTLLRCSLRTRVDNYPDVLFRLMLYQGREQEVFGHVELLTDPVRKINVFQMILEYLSVQPERQVEYEQIDSKMMEQVRFVMTMEPQSVMAMEFQSEVLRRLVLVLVRGQRWEVAEEVACSIPDGVKQTEALIELAKALVEVKYMQNPQLLWLQAGEAARSVSDGVKHAEILVESAKGLVDVKYMQKVGNLWRKAMEVARSIPDGVKHAEILVELAKTLVAVRWWEEAEKVARSIPDGVKRTEALVH